MSKIKSVGILKAWKTKAGFRAYIREVEAVLNGEKVKYPCGYVCIPSSHPFYGIKASSLELEKYSNRLDITGVGYESNGEYRLGFHTEYSGRMDPQALFEIRTLEYCRIECEAIAFNLAGLK